MSFGPLLVTAATIATTSNEYNLIWEIIKQTTPASLLVVSILHANNHRDLETDQCNNASTVAVVLGKSWSIVYYDFLVITPPLIAAYSWSLGALVLPLSWRLTRLIRSHNVPRDIDASTAQVMMLFGILSSISIAVV